MTTPSKASSPSAPDKELAVTPESRAFSQDHLREILGDPAIAGAYGLEKTYNIVVQAGSTLEDAKSPRPYEAPHLRHYRCTARPKWHDVLKVWQWDCDTKNGFSTPL